MNEQSLGVWKKTTIGETLVDIVAGKSPRAEGRPARGSEHGVLKVSAVSWGAFRPEENKALARSFVVDHSLTVRKGDVLLSRANTVELVGAVVQVDQDHPQLMLSDKTLRLVPRMDVVEPRFLMYALRTSEVRAVFEEDATGTSDSMRNLSQDKIRSAPISLPPLDVQRRIVAKLDALLAQSRAAREQLEAVPALVEQYRQSVLAAAFRGDLTADWRKKHPDVEPASKLLERIRLERRAKWEASELAKLKAKGKAPKDDKWKSKYVEPEPVDTSDLPELPPTWCWASLEEVCADVIDYRGRTPPVVPRDTGIPHVRTSNIRDGFISWETSSFVEPAVYDEYMTRGIPQLGDLLFTMEAPMGECGIIDRRARFSIAQRIILLRSDRESMVPEFLATVLRAPRTRAELERRATGTTVQGVAYKRLRTLPLPIAPHEEQMATAQFVRTALERHAAVVAAQASAGEATQMLERALLAKAFRGELVD